ncbi:MAG: zinc finger domain-containing protein [archaeon]
MQCTTCKKGLGKGSVSFVCPSCGKEIIHRCSRCRNLSVKYTCSKCSFSGP